MFQDFFKKKSFPIHLENFLKPFFREGQLGTNSLSVCPSSENVLISPSFLEDIFVGYRIQVDSFFFFFQPMKYIMQLLSTCMASDEKSTVVQIVFPYR